MADLLQIGSSGVFGHQKMLNTTGNNISNVSTEGYSRQRTLNKSQIDDMGLGRENTSREINKYAAAEVLLDTSASNNSAKYLSEITRTDQVLSDKSNNLDDGMSTLFKSLHTTNDDPTSLSNRQLVLSDAKNLINSFRNVGKQLNSQLKTANSELGEKPALLNSMVKQVFTFNNEIMIAENTAKGVTGALLDQRDNAIRDLAAEIDISTIDNRNGTISINLLSGQPLVMQSSVTQFKAQPGNPHSDRTELALQIDNNELQLQETELGGKVGALFEFRDDAVIPTLSEIGQLSLGIADAFNVQNRMGLNLDGDMGKDIYAIPSTVAKSREANSSIDHIVTAKMVQNEASELTTSEYEIEMTSPTAFDVFEIKDGVKSAALAVTGTFPGPVELTKHGFELDFSAAAGGFQAGDSFLVSPTLFNLNDIDIAISRPEDLAFASVLSSSRDINNTTTSELNVTQITDPNLSFTGNALNTTAPQKIVVNGAGDYDIFNGLGALMGTTSGALYGFDLFANSVPPLNPGVGYEVQMEGRPNSGETFNLSYNDDAIADNSNGLRLAGLENQDKLRRNHNKNGETQMTFSEGFSTLISNVGNKTRTARVDATASAAKLTQSEEWVSGTSGVSLDEEAANMVRYEQAYNASAQVVNISKEIFDTILNVGR